MSGSFPDFLVSEKSLTGVQTAQVASLGGDRLVYAFAIEGEKGGSRLILQTGSTKGDLSGAATQIDAADGESFAGFTLSALTDGHYAIAYATRSEAGFSDVTVKIFAADGSEEATAHLEAPESDRVLPGVLNLDGGAFLITFATHPKGEAETWQFQAQKFAPGGKADGSLVTLVDSVVASDFRPATTTTAEGSVVVAWIDEKSSTLHAQWAATDGKTEAREIIVSNRDAGAAASPALTTLKSGDVVIAWTTTDIDGKFGTTVHARVFTPAGEGRVDDITVGRPAEANQSTPSVTALTDGGFVIAWSANDKGDGDGATLYARIYNAEGAAVAEPFVLNSTGEGDQVSPHVAMLSEGRAVAIWLSGPADRIDIRATIFEKITPPADTNHAPQITSNGGADSAAISVLEGATAVTTVVATDTDAGQTLAYAITGGADAALFSVNTSSGALTFKTAPVFATPTDAGANNVYDVTIQVSDGHGGTDTQAIAITVGNNNHAPVITSNGAGASASISLLEGATAVTTVVATDTDAGQTLAYSITGGADAALFSVNTSTGALTFKTAPVFATPADAGANNVYDVTVQVSDGHGGTDTQAIAITVGNNNHAPVITSNGAGASASLSMLEGATAVTTVVATDTDVGQTLAYAITGGADAALFSVNTSTGALTFKTAPVFATPTDAGANNVYDVTVQVSDGHGGTDTQAIAITVGNNNHAPVITSNGAGASASLSMLEGATAVTTVVATDVDAGQTLAYSITGGADAALFSVNTSTGALTFKTAPVFATPADAGANNVYDVTVQVSDGHGGTDTQAIAITVGNNNHAPVITSNGAGASASLSMLEGATAVTTVVATDTDVGQTLAYAITGGADAALFSVNTSTGALTFKTAPVFATPTDAGANNVYDVTVQVSDGHGGTDTQAIAISVGDTNHAPVITGHRGELTVLALAEGATAVTKVDASDVDAKQSLTFSVSGLDAALFHIDPVTGTLAFNAPVSFANPQDAGGNNQYDLRVLVSDGHGGNDSHDYRIVVSEPAAAENVSAVIRVYQAAFGRAPDSDGLSYWSSFLTDGSANLEEIGRQFTNSAEFSRMYGATADTQAGSALVLAFYVNILGRVPDAEGLAYWSSLGVRADALLHFFASSSEFMA